MLDLTGVPSCIDTLSLTDCAATGGASFMFWIKLLDNTAKWIFTSTAWTPPKEGMQIRYSSNDKIRVKIFRQGTSSTNNYLTPYIETIMTSYIGEWLHVAVVWLPAVPRVDAYYNGEPQVLSGNAWVASWGYVHVRNNHLYTC